MFSISKPRRLIQRILQLATDKDSLILDSFAGSGTTGHAVLKLNQEDGGNRRFILVEMEQNIARNITAERVRRVSEGYTKPDGTYVEGLSGGFRYCRLGDPIFDEQGKIRKTITFSELSRHVYFTETREPISERTEQESPLLGIHNGVAIYLLYNGILKDKKPNGGNVLTSGMLAELPKHDGQKVIYGTACRIGPDRLRREGITFKQLPYRIRVDAV